MSSGARQPAGQSVKVELEKYAPAISRTELEVKLNFLREEKREIEARLKGINEQIGNLASKLEVPLSPGREKLLNALRNPETLAKVYVDKMLKKNGELSKEIYEHSKNIDYVYLEVETWLEALYEVMRTNSIAFLEADYELELIAKGYKNASVDNYRLLFNIIRDDFRKQGHGDEEISDFIESIDYLEKESFRFY
jgi:hypothetical protein